MQEDLRAALRADLDAERPPPLGDVVRTAIDEGRRIRRHRRLAVAGAAVAVLVVAAVVAFGSGPQLPALPSALPPGSVPSIPAAPVAVVPTRTVTVRNGTERAEGMQKKATPAAMLHLLTTLLPPGRTSHYAASADNDLGVQLYYDAGYGPSLLRLQVDRQATGRPRGAGPKVSVTHQPGECLRDTEVRAVWADGTTVRLDLATCLDPSEAIEPPARVRPTVSQSAVRQSAVSQTGVSQSGVSQSGVSQSGVSQSGVSRPAATRSAATRPAKAQLSEAVAALIVSDPHWGVTMDAALVGDGASQFPAPLAEFTR